MRSESAIFLLAAFLVAFTCSQAEDVSTTAGSTQEDISVTAADYSSPSSNPVALTSESIPTGASQEETTLGGQSTEADTTTQPSTTTQTTTTTHAPFHPFAMNYTYREWDMHCERDQMCVYNLTVPVNREEDFQGSKTELDKDSKQILPTMESELQDSDTALKIFNGNVSKLLEDLENRVKAANDTLTNLEDQANKLWQRAEEIAVMEFDIEASLDEAIQNNDCYEPCKNGTWTTEAPKSTPASEAATAASANETPEGSTNGAAATNATVTGATTTTPPPTPGGEATTDTAAPAAQETTANTAAPAAQETTTDKAAPAAELSTTEQTTAPSTGQAAAGGNP